MEPGLRGGVSDGVERGSRARPQAALGRGWHTKRAGDFLKSLIKKTTALLCILYTIAIISMKLIGFNSLLTDAAKGLIDYSITFIKHFYFSNFLVLISPIFRSLYI